MPRSARRHLGSAAAALALTVAATGAAPPLAAVAGVDRLAEAGAPGIGDPYFPLDGNGGIDVLHYDVRDRYAFGSRRLTGRTRLDVRATQALTSFHLDLLLAVRGVHVDGAKAAYRKVGKHELRITPARPLASGQEFRVTVAYAGRPATKSYAGESNWLANAHEVVTMNEPHMAPWWFPANDHPLDKATFDLRITVPKGKQVIANGLPQGQRTRGAWTTHHWRAADRMATYLAFFAAGDFAVDRGTSGGVPWINAASRHLPGNGPKVALRWLGKTPRITKWLASELGEYPFRSNGGLVTSLGVGFALENQTRPTYPYVGGGSTWLLVHELAHQWFGDSVSIAGWRDIWLNEGFASYFEYRWAETHGGQSVDSWLRHTYTFYNAGDGFWALSVADPGARQIFSGPVYERGALTLAALRNVVGDDAFGSILRTWVEERRDGNATTADFVALAERLSGRDLDAFFEAWVYAGVKPADTVANGLG
ncbi:M1 family metallopeptidase [Nocardioides bigeumensis]|uniref:Aminopeptidase N n=1 Tax=Nocardioides bigeumensis TaxID=433657 RepID=A0ABP5JJN6_9ACTN